MDDSEHQEATTIDRTARNDESSELPLHCHGKDGNDAVWLVHTTHDRRSSAGLPERRDVNKATTSKAKAKATTLKV